MEPQTAAAQERDHGVGICEKEAVPGWLQKHRSFYMLHVGYFLVLVWVGALLLWVCPDASGERISFIDALYCAASAGTVTGLMSLRIESLHLFQQTVMLLLTVLGSQIFTSLIPLYARRLAYRRILCRQAHCILARLSYCPQTQEKEEEEEKDAVGEAGKLERWKRLLVRVCSVCWEQTRRLSIRRVDIMAERIRGLGRTQDYVMHSEIGLWKSDYLQYKALTYLNTIVAAYFLLVQFAGFLLIRIYLAISQSASGILNAKSIDPSFFSLYNSVTSFSNADFTLLDNSMVPFREHAFLLLLLGLLILLGNTMFPSCLWFIITSLRHFQKENSFRRDVYVYLLSNPRRCFTHLFPQSQTLWLMVTVIAFNTLQILFFCILDWNSNALAELTAGKKMIDILFQTSATRNAGSNVVQLSSLSPAMLVLFLGLMAVAVYPVYLTRQKTKAFKKSQEENGNMAMEYYENQISVQSRKLLARDSAHLFIIVFVVCILENSHLREDPLNYSLFNVVFEVISAFGNVGMSVGYDCALAKSAEKCRDVPFSLSGKWNAGGKMLLAITMFLGRHRGLPDSVDSALLIPHETYLRPPPPPTELLQLQPDKP